MEMGGKTIFKICYRSILLGITSMQFNSNSLKIPPRYVLLDARDHIFFLDIAPGVSQRQGYSKRSVRKKKVYLP